MRDKKKILYIITKSNWGGAQRYVFDLATSLPTERFEVQVALGGEGLLKEKLVATGIETISISQLQRDISLTKEFLSFFSLLKIFLKKRPTILHLNSSKAAGLGALAARLAGVKRIIFTAHGWPFKEDRSLLIQWMIYVATWLTVFLSHRTIVVSKQDAELGKRMWFMSRKITHIPIALKAADDMVERSLAEQRLSFGRSGNTAYKTKYRLVTIAELTKNKGILPYGIEMIQRLERNSPGMYSYTIFGEGEDLPELQKWGNGLPIYFENMVELNIPLNLSTAASRYLRAFDIFILPSIKEGMPYVLLEAAAAGLPIVATEAVESMASDIPNMYIVPSKSSTALANKVLEISHDIEQKPFDTTHLFEKMLRETISVYKV